MSHPMLLLNKPQLTQKVDGSLDQEKFVKPLLTEVCKEYNSSRADFQNRLNRLVKRREAFVDIARKGGYLIELDFDNSTSASGYASGLAESGVIENVGIVHDFLSGLVLVPATGIKGAIRHTALMLDLLSEEEIGVVFGCGSDQTENERAGSVIFLDALPLQVPDLVIDVLCRHHEIDYSDEEPPADWEGTLPISFLVCKNLKIRVHLIMNETSFHLKDKLKACVNAAFSEFGIGAKTSSGYGWFPS